MVFESVVADLLNRVLGDYVENLDSSQLKLGIWGGDVVLHKLVLKQSAVDDLNLPVKTVAGHLGKLVLKINWKNIYSSPIHVTVEGLYLLAIPNLAVKYDAEKEEKALQEAKQRQLNRIELAKLQEATKNSENTESDGFVDKLKARLIKNLHITIEDVHLRYEDTYTYPERPFACGITLKKLAMESTNFNWEPTISPPESAQVFKLVSLDSLCLYWLCTANPLLSALDARGQLEQFRAGITSSKLRPYEDSYVLGPLTSQAQLRINPRPELDGSSFTIPKLFLNLVIEKLAVGLSKQQYHDVFQLLHAFQRMERAAPYRKFRASLPAFRGHAKQWWRFAYTCVLEEHVRRRRRNWHWTHIRDHRRTVRGYIDIYKAKLSQSKLNAQQQKELDSLEQQLDVFNITLARRQAEVQVERFQVEQRKREEQRAKQGWFSGWFGRGSAGSSESGSQDQGLVGEVMKKLQAEFSTEEKAKFYEAIGYEENATPASYPKFFVENLLQFSLEQLDILLHDTETQDVVLLSSLTGVNAVLEQRPAAQAIKASVRVTDFNIEGSPSVKHSTRLVRAFDQSNDRNLLAVLFETNPLDETCDQRIQVAAQPLVISYHEESIRKLSDMFQAPEPADFSHLQATARQKLEDLKEMSTTGLQFAIEKHAVVDIDIDIRGSYVLLPYGGRFDSGQGMVLLNMGSLSVRSEDLRKKGDIPNVSKMVRSGSTEQEIWKQMRDKSYDKLKLELFDIQVLSLMENEDWLSVVKEKHTKCHMLRPVRIQLLFERCLILDDPRLPKIKISGDLPSLYLDVNENRLVNMAIVLQSLSPAGSEPQVPVPVADEREMSAIVLSEESDLRRIDSISAQGSPRESVVQAIDLAVSFYVRDVNVMVNVSVSEKTEPLLEFSMQKMELDLTCRTFDTSAMMTLENVTLQHSGFGIPNCKQKLSLISSRTPDGEPTCLLAVNYLEVNPRSPEFRSKYQSVRKKITVAVCSLTTQLHLEALLSTLKFANDVTSRIEGASKKAAGESSLTRSTVTAEKSLEATGKASATVRKKGQALAALEDVNFKLEAQMELLRIDLMSVCSRLAEVYIQGVDLGVTIKASETALHAGLAGFQVIDCSEGTLYPKVAAVDEKEALQVDLVLFNNSSSSPETDMFDVDLVDIDIRCSTGRLKAIFLNRFVNDLLAFVDHFQTAKDKLIEASSAAAQSIRENVQVAYATATRIKLDVNVKAPYIIVPRSSRSKDALLVDLGHLTLKNRFELSSQRNELGYHAVLDSITILLQELQLKRVVIDGVNYLADNRLLGPVAVDVSVQRNLSSSWYTSVPDVSILARIGRIRVVLDREDYSTSMKILLENLAEEGQALTKAQAVQRAAPDEGSTATSSGTLTPMLESQFALEGSDKTTLEQYGPVRTKLALTAELDEIELELLDSSRQKQSLAKFAIRSFAAAALMMSDNSLMADVALVSCLLEDTRPKTTTPSTPVRKTPANPIVRVFYAKDSVSSSQKMIAVSFESTASQQSRLSARISGFTLILCPSYLMKLAQFFTEGLPQEPSTTKAVEPALPTGSNPQSVMDKSRISATDSFMTVSVKLDRPDIVLVEEMDMNSHSLIMNMEADLVLKLTPTSKNASGSISQVHLFSAVFDPALRKETSAEVLSPCTIQMLVNMKDDTGFCRVNVDISDVMLSVSPGTIELLAKLSKTLNLNEPVEPETQEIEVDTKHLWKMKSVSELSLPFLEVEVGQEVEVKEKPSPQKTSQTTIGADSPLEQLIFDVSRFSICLEGGRKNQTYPLVLLESRFTADVQNWSSGSMKAEAILEMKADYYNSAHALWEPLLELVEDGHGNFRRWQLLLGVTQNRVLDYELDYEISQKPPLSINIESTDNMEITVTRNLLDVVEILGEAFGAAVKQQLSKKEVPVAPYMIRNDLDLNIELELANSEFTVTSRGDTGAKVIVLQPSTEVGLMAEHPRSREEKLLTVSIPEFNYRKAIPVSRSCKRYLPCGQREEPRGFIVDVRNEFGFRLIAFRSIVQICNYLRTPVDVYYMTKRGNEVEGVGRLEGSKTLNVPPKALYTPTGEIFFSPDGYSVSYEAYVWRDVQRYSVEKTVTVLECPARNDPNGDSFYFQIVGEAEQVYLEDTRKKLFHCVCYQIHLRPTAIFHNLLPVAVNLLVSGTVNQHVVQPGESLDLTAVKPGLSTLVLKIMDYMDRDWSCKDEVKREPPELSVWSFESYEGTSKATLNLGMYCVVKDTSLHFSLYCPFWMINKTGLMLTYKGDDDVLYHPENIAGPIMFSFRPKAFFGKKKATVRVEDSSWSAAVSLDAAGNSGTLTCTSDEMNYQLGVHNELSSSTLTRLLTFTPYYMITNRAPFDVEAREGCPHLLPTNPEWLSIPSGQSVPFWPKISQKLIIFRIAGTTEETKAVTYDSQVAASTLLRVDNDYGALQVDFNVTESSVMIVCDRYQDGHAPALLINNSQSAVVDIAEVATAGAPPCDTRVLLPQQACYFTWEHPGGPRQLSWKCDNKEFKNSLENDATGAFSEATNGLRWISFLHGRQRVVLFTDELGLIGDILRRANLDIFEQEITVSINGIGLSLTDIANRCEVLYAGVRSSGIVWETSKNGRNYRAMKIRDCSLIEDVYQRHLKLVASSDEVNPVYTIEGGLEVDFSTWKIHRPKTRHLRRSYQAGLWLNVQLGQHSRLTHLKVNRLQIDNQLPDCVFPVILAPVPPPKSVAALAVPHPFIETSVVQRFLEGSDLPQFQYVKLLVQELHVRLDMSLVNALGTMLAGKTNALQSEADMKDSVEKDLALVRQGLTERAAVIFKREPENYFGYLHLSPLKIHFSFSNTGGGGPVGSPDGNNPLNNILGLLLRTVGVSVTEVQDVVLRLAYFERANLFISWNQLTQDLQSHYVGQAVKQFYVLVLGLDVLGNPYGLAMGITRGVEQLFYEPIQGFIQGPDEFLEGLAIGAQSLVGHTLGGFAGAASRITGTIGKGLASLSFDEEFQAKRRENLLRRPANITENLAQGGKGLFMGFVEGVSGVVTKPIQGAQQQGVEGFFKGIGKGVAGLVARPTAGIMDFASGSLDVVKRVTDVNEETSRMRPPRFVNAEGILHHYVRHHAEGNNLLQMLEKGKFERTDHYVEHAVVGEDGKQVLMVTDHRVMLLFRHDLFGQWQVDWGYTYDELSDVPSVSREGIFIPLVHTKKKVLGLFASKEAGKKVVIKSPETAVWMAKKIEETMKSRPKKDLQQRP